MHTQAPLAEIKPKIFSQNLVKKQNDNNLIDLNFFDSIDNSKRVFSNGNRTSVLEAFDPLLHNQSNMSSSETDQGTCTCLFLILSNYQRIIYNVDFNRQ